MQEMESCMARMLFSSKQGLEDISGSSKWLAQAAIRANHAFLPTRSLVRANVVNVFSSGTGLNESVLSEFHSTFGTPCETRLGVGQPYTSMVGNLDIAQWYAALRRSMGRVKDFPFAEDDDITQVVNEVEAQAAPVYPLKTAFTDDHPLKWLDENDRFQQWLDGTGPTILHLYGSTVWSYAAEYAFWKLESRRDENAEDQQNSWTDRDAFAYLKRIRVELGAVGRVVWIIDGFDQCDSSRSWCLADLLSSARGLERYFKLLFTTSGNSTSSNTLQPGLSVDLESHSPKQGSTMTTYGLSCYPAFLPELRDYFVPGGQGIGDSSTSCWFKLSEPEEDHRHLAEACLSALAGLGDRHLDKHDDDDACSGKAIVSCTQPGILSYAMHYWHVHYSYGYSGQPSLVPQDHIHPFFGNPRVAESWKHWCQSHLGLKDANLASPSKRTGADSPDLVVTALAHAAARGQEATVEALVELGLSRPQLIQGVERSLRTGQLDIANTLASLVPPEESKDVASSIPIFLLSRAAWYGHRSLVQSLLAAGAPVNPGPDDITPPPLHCAAAMNHPGVAHILLQHGASHSSKYGRRVMRTPLQEAARLGHTAMVSVLVKFGASMLDRDGENSSGLSALTWALKATISHSKIIEMSVAYPRSLKSLLDSGYMPDLNPESVSKFGGKFTFPEGYWGNGFNALLVAARLGNEEIVRSLLGGGAQVSTKSPDEKTPLHLALENNKEPSFGTSSSSRSPLCVNDTEGYLAGPLYVALPSWELGNGKAAPREPGGGGGGTANLCEEARNGTPLMAAFFPSLKSDSHKVEGLARYLMEDTKADVNARGGLYGTALNMAVSFGPPELVQMLLERDAEMHVPDLVGRQPVHLACKRHDPAYLELLLGRDDIDFSVEDKLGRTTLHYAAGSGSVRIIDVVLSKTRGLDLVNKPDSDGWTPLFWAVRDLGSAVPKAGQEQVVKSALGRGCGHLGHGSKADRNKEDASGRKWDKSIHKTRRGKMHTFGCDICLFNIRGKRYKSDSCLYDICFKCYSRRQEFLPGLGSDAYELDGSPEFSEESSDDEKEEDESIGRADLSAELDDDDDDDDEYYEPSDEDEVVDGLGK
ncbi:hypothetical protein MKZ38_001273 [Zalerion maritima]|uniref:ZZ-type domain-containing protein n=1 Tax=Zalerion maritima TaxID=339359 RepID=A0AAD5WT86_9PEZI|nr:hypothetical protein MKZ38_001273 [Zalerion maritima]